jgi:N-methylhydantoinase A
MKNGVKPGYIIATDVGGTCTDTLIIAEGETPYIGKALSTPPNFAQGVIDSIESALPAIGLSIDELFQQTQLFLHGSTVAENTILTGDGARTGLITTAGFEDTLLMTRGAYGRWGGLTEDEIKHPIMTDRPPPIVTSEFTRGVKERVDYKGAIVADLDEGDAERAVRFLVENKKAEAIAVSLLWSIYNSTHERKIRDIIQRVAPDVQVSLSSDAATVPGEYERTSTTAINAYTGKIVKNYLLDLKKKLSEHGHGHAGLWRPAAGRGSGQRCDRNDRKRPRRWRHRDEFSRRADGRSECDRRRHGRNHFQGKRGPGRAYGIRSGADGRTLPLRRAKNRSVLDRRRRR